MNRIAILSITLLYVLGGGVASSAGAEEPQTRQARQRTRIHTGVENGSLVQAEARRLRNEQRRIRQAKRHVVANDGKIGPAERARLQRMQDRSSRHIFRAKHNARKR